MGRVAEVTNALGVAAVYAYDARGNKTYEGGATYPVAYAYDVYGSRISMTTYRDESGTEGDTTTWAYDEASGLVVQKLYADGHGPCYTYSDDGRLTTRTWARGVVTTYGYDAWGNLTSTTYSDGTPSVTLTYDALGRRASVTDAAGTTAYAYDAYGDLAAETWGGLGGRVLTRHRDAYGRDAGYSVNGSRRTTLGYDAATGRLAAMDADGDFVWQHLAGSDLKSRLTYPNGIMTDYTYEPTRDLLTGVRNSRGETVCSEYLYANDALGRRTAKNAEQYGYNDRSELVSAATNGTNDYAYAYDAIGNRLSSAEPGKTLEYIANNLNQYASISNSVPSVPPCETFNPVFDADGNQTLVKTSTGTWSVEYNAENRPVRWTRGNTVVTMDFDSMGRRTFYREVENGREVAFFRFFYDGYLMIQQLHPESPYDIYKEFIWDPTEPVATKPLCFRQDGETATFLMHDGNKNVTDVIRAAPYNDSVGHYEYAPFGAVHSQTGSRAVSNPFRFSSEFADDALGLVYYNYRHYDGNMGRFLSRDPARNHAENRYMLVHNDPQNLIDVLGENCCSSSSRCFNSLSEFRYYGNWGGPGWSGGQWVQDGWLARIPKIKNVSPSDDLDECYREHDICYENCRANNRYGACRDFCFSGCDFKSLLCQSLAFADISKPLNVTGYVKAPLGIVGLGSQGVVRLIPATMEGTAEAIKDTVEIISGILNKAFECAKHLEPLEQGFGFRF
ncbi:MAG: RHS repeat-associated core domain-containing protein [Kiritimatiellia bacterium]